MKINRRVTVIMIISMLILLIGIQYIHINTVYCEPKKEEYLMGESFNYRGVEVSVTDSVMMESKDISELLKGKAIVVTIILKNNSEETKKVESDFFQVQCLDWNNGMSYEVFMALNGTDVSPNVTLNPGEEVALKLPYSLYDFQFPKDRWDNIVNEDFKLTLEVYPVKRTVNLEL